MPDPQLLTKQVVDIIAGATGVTKPVRFNLQRGKIARIWGFLYMITGDPLGTREHTMFVRKTPNSERATTPSDILWSIVQQISIGGADFAYFPKEHQVFFPKPHRTSGITVQMHCSVTTPARGLLIIYYDIDDVSRGDLAQRWEKSRGKKYDRRMLAP